MGKVIGFINLKGGVGKTTLATHLSYLLANEYKKKVLLIDYDAQGNSTKAMGLVSSHNENLKEDEEPLYAWNIKNVMGDLFNDLIEANIKREETMPDYKKYITRLKNVDLIPNNDRFATVSNNLMRDDVVERERILKYFFDNIKNDYDYIIVDSMPTFCSVVINLMFACDEIIVPTPCQDFSIEGLVLLNKNLNMVNRSRKENPLKVKGMVITLASERTNAFAYYRDLLENDYKQYYLFKSIIPYTQKYEEGGIFRQLWVEREPNGKLSKRLKEFAKEFIELEKGE